MVYQPYEELDMMKKQCFDANHANAAMTITPVPFENRTVSNIATVQNIQQFMESSRARTMLTITCRGQKFMAKFNSPVDRSEFQEKSLWIDST